MKFENSGSVRTLGEILARTIIDAYDPDQITRLQLRIDRIAEIVEVVINALPREAQEHIRDEFSHLCGKEVK